ncbi:MAG: thioredoxin [Clostridia bacterium]|nr:thioredoxin [Clostridia bacterium]
MALINVTKDNFEETVKSGKTVLLDFWATWCGPCRMIAPTVHEIAEECEDITVGKINVDEEAELAMKFGIVSIPTLVVIKDGKAVNQAVGVQTKEKILEMLQ